MRATEEVGWLVPAEGTIWWKAPWGKGCRGQSRLARKVRTLWLALPFLDSELEREEWLSLLLKIGRGKVGGREGALLGAENFPLQGLTGPPGWLAGILTARREDIRRPDSWPRKSSHHPLPRFPPSLTCLPSPHVHRQAKIELLAALFIEHSLHARHFSKHSLCT